MSRKEIVYNNDLVVLNKKQFMKSYQRRGLAENALANINWLPLIRTEELAELVGYIFADGSVERSYDAKRIRPKRIDFISGSTVMRKRVYFLFNEIFSVKPKKHLFRETKGFRIRSAAAARALWLLGIPMGAKVSQYYAVPKWITNSNRKIKRKFIRAYFDCDASKPYKLIKKKATFGIRVTVNKTEDKVANGLMFLNSMKDILSEFGVECNGPYTRNSKVYVNKNGVKTIMLELLIQRQLSFLNYARNVGFTEPAKKVKLKVFAKDIVDNTNYII